MTRRIRATIVDDEALSRLGVRQLLSAHADVDVVAECRDGPEAIESLQRTPCDVMFLDIQMPEQDGFSVMREAAGIMTPDALPLTIFLTAYEEFALDAFSVEAIDYLVKPVREERFDEALRRIRRRLAERGESAASPSGMAVEPTSATHLVAATARGQRIIPLEDIDWIAAEDYYVAVRVSGKKYLIREPLTSLEARLNRREFVRIHRGALVNVRRLLELRTSAGEMVAVLRDGTELPVSRRRRAALQSLVNEIAAGR